jgi:Cys-tRNA(Pro) deacylase
LGVNSEKSPQERVRQALLALGLPAELTTFDASTHTAQAAADAVGCRLGQIVKTLFFLADERATIALVAGDRQVDTALLAQLLGVGRKKLKMGSPEAVLKYTGFPVGGVSPVGAKKPCDVVVDESLKRFDDIWAAAGNSNTVFPASTDALVAAVHGQWAAITRDAA